MSKREMISTKYKGVFYDSGNPDKPYYAQLMYMHIGDFETAYEAAIAYDREFSKQYPTAIRYGTNRGQGLLGLGGNVKIILKPDFRYLCKDK